ncbi:MAG: hypothetical protein NW226_27100 [Microscillaceae bacterium]|nr:hypothetical protein [Microscillaceae bacterium]
MLEIFVMKKSIKILFAVVVFTVLALDVNVSLNDTSESYVVLSKLKAQVGPNGCAPGCTCRSTDLDEGCVTSGDNCLQVSGCPDPKIIR